MKSSRQAIVVGTLLAVGAACEMSFYGPAGRGVEVGVWFEAVTYASNIPGGPMTASDLEVIEATARSEVAEAFRDYPVTVSSSRDARYRVAVVQRVLERRLRREADVAGESRAISGFGGSGAVNFTLLASGAVACAPEEADRHAIIQAIGRGVGRTVVHEVAHQLLPSAPIHDTTDVNSYEYGSASRCERYFGEMHWGHAAPLLRARFSR
jgi:hypothetical protein